MFKIDKHFVVFILGFGGGMWIVNRYFTEKRKKHNIELEHIESLVRNNAQAQYSNHYKSVYTSPHVEKVEKTEVKVTEVKPNSPYSSLMGGNAYSSNNSSKTK